MDRQDDKTVAKNKKLLSAHVQKREKEGKRERERERVRDVCETCFQ